MTDNLTDADAKAICAALGVDTKTITDTFGRSFTVIDEAGMRALAAHSPDPARAQAFVEEAMAAVNAHYRTG